MDLREAGVGEAGAALVGRPGGGDIAGGGVGGKIKNIGVAAGAQKYGMAGVRLEFPGQQIADGQAAGLAVLHHDIHHFAAGQHGNGAGRHLAHHGRIGAQQQLLAGLAPGIKSARNLRAAERAVRQQAAVVPAERHAYGRAMIDYLVRDLRQPVDVRFAGAVVAAFYRVVEETPDGIPVVGVILRGVYPALRRYGVRAAGGIVQREDFYVVAQLAQRGRGRSPGQTGAHHEHVVLAAVVGVYQLKIEFMRIPFLFYRSRGDLSVEFHLVS